MPTLAQLVSLATKASYNSRGADEVLHALDEAGRKVYFAVLNEPRLASFLKFDTTSLTFTAGTSLYTLPADLGRLKQIAERQTSSLPWRRLWPSDLNDPDFMARERAGEMGTFDGDCGPDSQFDYAGPFLDGASAQGGIQAWKIEIAPVPQPGTSYQVRLIYEAEWVPVVNGSFLTIPDEGRGAMLDFAIADLLRLNSDANAETFKAEAQIKLDWFLTWMRTRQTQQTPRLRPYTDDLD